MSALNAEHLHDEEAAYAWVEAHVWPNGPVCPKCGGGDRIGKMGGKSTRIGTYKCYACRKPFTVKVGTIFEDSHVKMHIWLQAIYLMCSSKKGISSNQLHRTLGVTLKTAWFMSHRIREAMRSGSLAPMGGPGSIVEADETFIGKKEGAVKHPNARGYAHKQAALSLIERGGEIRSFVIDKADTANVKPIIDANLRKESMLMTDEAAIYGKIGKEFKHHFTVEHGKDEYVRGSVHVNTLEGYFSIFKRGMKGVYQHCDEKHLHRYLAEFDFRYNNRVAKGVNDGERATKALLGIQGKRLKYRDSSLDGESVIN
ncbi:IS1595 family transposase [Rhodomicrobium sp. Az07]|uniref:IS1595 family transposase n=1 Tax=Rhodomicrobium sp. Az07 TaxID=2839034 RepID=UPI001BE957BA|nr:IS1595 family transposase [Rhodomicrobium sp. Az07]MBT3071680.1 IS1595 family transposase [Rhodomicrobium sp. Az07]